MLARRALVAALAVLTVLGVAALVVGIGMRTFWLPPDTVTSTADVSEGPVAITAPGVLEMRDGPVTAELTGEGAVHLARMREQDALAWVGASAHTTLTGLQDETTLATEVTEGEATVPDPDGSVMWLDSESGQDQVVLTWQDRPGRFLLVAAGDGTAAPQRLALTWPVVVSTPYATPLVALGAVLLVLALGLGVLLAFRRGRTPGATETETGTDNENENENENGSALTDRPEEVRP